MPRLSCRIPRRRGRAQPLSVPIPRLPALFDPFEIRPRLILMTSVYSIIGFSAPSTYSAILQKRHHPYGSAYLSLREEISNRGCLHGEFSSVDGCSPGGGYTVHDQNGFLEGITGSACESAGGGNRAPANAASPDLRYLLHPHSTDRACRPGRACPACPGPRISKRREECVVTKFRSNQTRNGGK